MSKELARNLIKESILNKAEYDYSDYDSYTEDPDEDVTEEEIIEEFKNLEVDIKFIGEDK